MRLDPLDAARLYLQGLASLHLRRRVAREEIDWLLERSPPVEYPPGRLILKHGEAADAALMVVYGELTVSVPAADGERVLGSAGPWDVVGETALYAPERPRSATVRAARDSACLVVGQGLLREGRDNAAVVAIEYHLLHTLTERIRVTNQALHEAWVDLEGARAPVQPVRSASRQRLLDLVAQAASPEESA